MNKVVTIHLDGIAYSLEESAYDSLRAYLDAAKATLGQNPDKDEIIKDLEQAIGAKLSTYLSAHKNVLTQSDVDAVLAEMGPVAAEGSTSEKSAEGESGPEPVKKQLYRIREGRVLAGVCNGLAAYFNVDVTLVRILFVLFTILIHGLGILVYILLVFILPVARTPKDYENATGIPPVTAQELVDRAKKGIEDFANSNEWQQWRSNWNNQRREWKQQQRAWKKYQKNQRYDYSAAHAYYARPKSFLSELSEFIWSMFGLVVVVFFVWFLYHHVGFVQQFIDFLHRAWDSLFYAIVQNSGNK